MHLPSNGCLPLYAQKSGLGWKDVTCDCGYDSEIAARHYPIHLTSSRLVFEVPGGEANECELQSHKDRSDSFRLEEGAEQHVCIEDEEGGREPAKGTEGRVGGGNLEGKQAGENHVNERQLWSLAQQGIVWILTKSKSGNWLRYARIKLFYA